MVKTCDLHTHSNESDGSMTPTELVAAAVEAGLSAIALTDHNTTKGLIEFKEAAKQAGIEGICGCEFTTEYEGMELHLLGLFLPQNKWSEIDSFLEKAYAAKLESLKQCVERLQADSYPISYKQFQERYSDVAVPNRVHVALLLIEAQAIDSVQYALDELLVDGGKYYKAAARPHFLDMIERIDAWGAAPVWAHPLGEPGTDPQTAETLLALGKEKGLIGAEAMYSKYSPEKTEIMKRLCKRHGLVASGSTDFHGTNKPGISLGKGFGSLCVPYSVVDELKTAMSAR